MKMKKLKNETYRKIKIIFIKTDNGRYGVKAKVPKITTQYLGVGRIKKQAFDEAKDEIDKYLSKKDFIEGF